MYLFGRAAIVAAAVACVAVVAPAAMAAGTAVVRQDSLQGWAHKSQATSSHAFVTGPGTPPLGTGSLQMLTGTGSGTGAGSGGKEWFFHAAENGTPLSALSALGYGTYQAPSSAGPEHLVPSLQFGVSVDGDDTWDTTIVYEPVYSGTVVKGEWQTWDALAGNWWSTRPVGAVCRLECFVPWATLMEQWPDAKIVATDVAGIQVVAGQNSAGAPWSNWDGNVDAVTIGVGDDVTTYDLEPGASPPPAQQCRVNAGVSAFGRTFRVCV